MLYRYVKDYEKIRLAEYPIAKETDKTWTILGEDFKKHVIRKEILRKAYAYPTKEQAFTNFKKRTEKHLAILENQIEEVKDWLKKIKEVEDREGILSIPVKNFSEMY